MYNIFAMVMSYFLGKLREGDEHVRYKIFEHLQDCTDGAVRKLEGGHIATAMAHQGVSEEGLTHFINAVTKGRVLLNDISLEVCSASSSLALTHQYRSTASNIGFDILSLQEREDLLRQAWKDLLFRSAFECYIAACNLAFGDETQKANEELLPSMLRRDPSDCVNEYFRPRLEQTIDEVLRFTPKGEGIDPVLYSGTFGLRKLSRYGPILLGLDYGPKIHPRRAFTLGEFFGIDQDEADKLCWLARSDPGFEHKPGLLGIIWKTIFG